MLHYFEFIGMVLSMFGAWYAIGTDHKKNKNAKGLGFLFFSMSNLAMMTFAFYAGLYALMIQMFIFNISSVWGVFRFNPKYIYIPVFAIAISVWSFILFNLFQKNGFSLEEMSMFELTAAIIAVIGAYVFLSKEKFWINLAFICYFVADIIYLYVSYEKGFIFFGILSAFFVLTSSRGFYYLNFKKNKHDLKNS